MSSKRIQFLGLAIAILIVASLLRFYDLGRWPFAGDETATLQEVKTLFHEEYAPPQSQTYRLPHLIPVGYILIRAGQAIAGSTEYGSRFMMALAGIVGVVAIFMLLDGLMGRPTAVATALLATLWPADIFQSQEARFYAAAALFAFLSMLVGAYAFRRKPALASSLACVLVLVGTLTHTLLLALLPLILVAIIAGFYAERHPVPKSLWWVFGIAAVIAGGLFLFYMKPLVHGWNHGSNWGYSVIHSILASIVTVGWPVSLLAAIGMVMMLSKRSAQNWYWVTCFFGWVAATVLLPLIVVYQPSYIFPFSLGAFVMAGYAIGEIYKHLQTRGKLAALAWLLLMCLSNLPSLVSYYADGDRVDYRGAVKFVQKNWVPGDRLTAFSPGLVKYYAKGCCKPIIPLPLGSKAEPALAKLTAHGGRLWILLESGRHGLPANLQEWLFAHAWHKFEIKRMRIGYDDYVLDVYLYSRRMASVTSR